MTASSAPVKDPGPCLESERPPAPPPPSAIQAVNPGIYQANKVPSSGRCLILNRHNTHKLSFLCKEMGEAKSGTFTFISNY